MDNYHATWSDRASLTGYRCEADGIHHQDCPGKITDQVADQFKLHHMIRKSDTDHPWHADRDDMEFLRLVWNGPTGMGCSGCHNRIHQDLPKARGLDLFWPTHRTSTASTTGLVFTWDGEEDPF